MCDSAGSDLPPSVEGTVSLSSALSVCTAPSPTLHHSILHHRLPPGGNQAYDTLSLESSDSLETSVSTGNSVCTPERWEAEEEEQPTLFPWEHPNLPPSLRRKVTALCSCDNMLCCTWLHRLLPCQPHSSFEVQFTGVSGEPPAPPPPPAALPVSVFGLQACLFTLFHPEPCHSRVIEATSPLCVAAPVGWRPRG